MLKTPQYKLSQWPKLFLPVFMLSCLPIMTSWLNNRYQVTIQDLGLPLILAFITSLMITAIGYRSFKHNKLAGLLGALFITLHLDSRYSDRLNTIFPLLKAINPFNFIKANEGIYYSFIFLLIIIGVAFIIVHYVNRLTQNYRHRTEVLANTATIVIAVGFLLQLSGMLRVAIAQWPQYFYRPPQIASQAKLTAGQKPDIYYIVLDRYTSQSVLKSQFGFDNADFINYLKENNFSVDPNARDNYPFTTMSIASTLNANYNSDLVEKFSKAKSQTVQPYHDSIRNSSVVQALKSLGYSYTLIGSWYEASNASPLADQTYQPEGRLTIFNHTFALDSFSGRVNKESFFWEFIQHPIGLGNFTLLGYSGIDEAEATPYKIDQLKKIANQPAGGRFVFAHILVPHDPYYFKADGSRAAHPESNNVGQPIKQKYLGQVQFINNQMKSVIDEIKKNSHGQAVIVLQSDEGPYSLQLNDELFDYAIVGDELGRGNMLDWSNRDLQMKYGILAAYDLPNVKPDDLARADSVNIFRVIFNTYFNGALPYLPKCYYGYPNGRDTPFVFKNINQILTGQANTDCPDNGDVKSN